jgi:hypothetical protein
MNKCELNYIERINQQLKGFARMCMPIIVAGLCLACPAIAATSASPTNITPSPDNPGGKIALDDSQRAQNMMTLVNWQTGFNKYSFYLLNIPIENVDSLAPPTTYTYAGGHLIILRKLNTRAKVLSLTDPQNFRIRGNPYLYRLRFSFW